VALLVGVRAEQDGAMRLDWPATGSERVRIAGPALHLTRETNADIWCHSNIASNVPPAAR
jgi:hypothetical protein